MLGGKPCTGIRARHGWNDLMAIVGKVQFGVVWLNCGLPARPGMHR